MPSTLVARDLTKSYGPHVVLDAVSITVAPGDRIGIVAPNGTGKSTLLRVLAGIESVDAGRVELRPARSTVGYLPQEHARRAGETLHRWLARRTGVFDAETELDSASHGLARGEDDANDRYANALDRYLALGGPDFDARVGVVAQDVGLEPRLFEIPVTALSGGQMARAALAAILLARFDVFLLDEPTNDLDFAGLERLERFVRDLPAGAVIVSHDRAFLERTINAVVEIDEHTHRSSRFDGGWQAYLDERSTQRRHAEERYSTFVEQRDQLKSRAQARREWSQQGTAKAKRSGETDKFIKQFKMNSSEHVAAKAKRTDRALDRLEVVDKPWESWELRFDIAEAGRASADAVVLEAAVMQRGDFVLGPLDLHVAAGERVAITGPNGCGKSTLLAAILGTLPLASGRCRVGPGVVLGTLAQARARFDDAPTLLDGFVAETGATVSEARSTLAKFGLSAEHVGRPAASLSPGERTRAELALLMARGVNLLVLDEPTNHLDLTAIEQLEQALGRYRGTLLLVTHDRRLLDAVHLTRTIPLG